jgi:hypothetical protein
MSDYDTYSRIHAKSMMLSEDGVRWHLDTDSTKTVTLKCTPSASGNIDLQLPTSAGTLMRTNDDLDSRNLVHGTLLSSVTPVDADSFLIYDASASDAPRRVIGTSLKAYIGAGLPTGNTPANVLVADGSGVFQSVALSGDATVNASGVLSLASDSVGSAQIEANAVTAGKLNINGATLLSGHVIGVDEMLLYDDSSASNVKVPMSGVASYVSAHLSVGSVSSLKIVDGAVTTAKLASDAVTTVKILDANVTTAKIADANVTTAKLADANVTEGKLASNAVSTAKIVDANITTAKLADDCVTSAKLAPAVALDTSVEAPIVYIGNNKWKMELSTNDLVFSYWNGSAWVVGQTIGAP